MVFHGFPWFSMVFPTLRKVILPCCCLAVLRTGWLSHPNHPNKTLVNMWHWTFSIETSDRLAILASWRWKFSVIHLDIETSNIFHICSYWILQNSSSFVAMSHVPPPSAPLQNRLGDQIPELSLHGTRWFRRQETSEVLSVETVPCTPCTAAMDSMDHWHIMIHHLVGVCPTIIYHIMIHINFR